MVAVGVWMSIRCFKAKGWGTRAIARELGVCRNTVRKALMGEGPPAYSRSPRPNPQLEPFVAEISAMLFEQHFIGTRILRELRQRGYQGSPAALYRHLRKLRQERLSERGSQRSETLPGHPG